MSYNIQGFRIGNLTAPSDYSGNQFLAVDAATTGGQMVLQTTAGGRIIGILQDKPTSGQPGQIQVSGVSKAICGSAGATAGDSLMVDTAGKLTTATTGKRIVAVALATAVSGDIFPVLLMSGANVA